MNSVTDIRVYPVNHNKVKANGDFLVGGSFRVRFTLFQTAKGLFPALPSEKYQDNEGDTKYKDLVYLPKKEEKQELQKLLIAAYEKTQKKTTSDTSVDDSDIPF